MEAEFKELTANAFGKTVNYGNGVSVNTDDVVYIEYGPYHTYTFKINRENAAADAPVENLILSLEPDGTYKELVKTYNLTQNDWQELSLGNGIDLDGKTTTVEVAKGTYYQANAKSSGCSYQSQQVYQACCHGVHGEGNIGEWGNCTCTGNGLPKMYTIEILVCPPEPGAPTNGWVPTPSSPTAPSGVGGEPLDGGSSSVSETNPTDPNTVEGAQGQLGGTPTLPLLQVSINPNTPCGRVNALTSNQTFKNNLIALSQKLNLGSETGYRMDYTNQNPTSPLGNGMSNQFLQNKPGTKQVDLIYFVPATYAIIHTHYNKMNDPIFSPEDLIQFNTWLVAAKAWNDNPANLPKVDLKKLSYTLVTDFGNYMLTFDGTNVAPFSGYNIGNLNNDYFKLVINPAATQYASGEVNFDMNKLEENFLKFSKKYLSMPGMKLFKLASDGNKEIFLDNNNKKDTNTCN